MREETLARMEVLNGETLAKVSNGKNEITTILGERQFDISKPPPLLEYCLTVDMMVGNGREIYDVGSYGMLGLVTGEAKSRKTTFLSALVASALSGGKNFINIKADIKGKEIVFVDTEQPEHYFYKTQKRIHFLSGSASNYDNYKAYKLRDLSIGQRLEAIDSIVEQNKNLGLLIIDGALDLVLDLNSQTECQTITQRFMDWTEKSKALIITVIHNSFGYSKAIGHLGSYLQRKCDFSIEMKYDDSSKFTTVKHKLARSKPFPGYEFTQDDYGYPILDHLQKVQLPAESSNGYFPTSERPEIQQHGNGLDDNDDIPF